MATGGRLAEIAPLAEYLERNLTMIDAGCRWGLAEAWSALGRKATIYGFDPDAEECRRLTEEHRGPCDVRFIPVALGRAAGEATLYRTREPACSSLYQPDAETIRLHPVLACATELARETVRLETLDGWAERSGVQPIDAIKLDTQGAELDILQGAERCLTGVRMLEIEVEFNPIYRDQPLFGDVDRFLRPRGFVLWRLSHLVHYGKEGAESTLVLGDRHYFDSREVVFPAEGGQLFWGHAYYVRGEALDRPHEGDWRDSLRDACLAAALGSGDLALKRLRDARSNAPAGVAEAIDRTLRR